ncbi:Hypothetical_protein [Hexamita inflata]|uniref:Hypothetical_protein n=1 Tax=Hexamita inflata TaxID=28002 RepID=A0ABP1GZ23_9EUKA
MEYLALCQMGIDAEDLELPNFQNLLQMYVDKDIAQLYYDAYLAKSQQLQQQYQDRLHQLENSPSDLELILMNKSFPNLLKSKPDLTPEQKAAELKKQLSIEINNVQIQMQRDKRAKEITEQTQKKTVKTAEKGEISYPFETTAKVIRIDTQQKTQLQQANFQRRTEQKAERDKELMLKVTTQPTPASERMRLVQSQCKMTDTLENRSQRIQQNLLIQQQNEQQRLQALDQRVKQPSFFRQADHTSNFLQKYQNRMIQSYNSAQQTLKNKINAQEQFKTNQLNLETKQKERAESIKQQNANKYKEELEIYENKRKIAANRQKERANKTEEKIKTQREIPRKYQAVLGIQKKKEYQKMLNETKNAILQGKGEDAFMTEILE